MKTGTPLPSMLLNEAGTRKRRSSWLRLCTKGLGPKPLRPEDRMAKWTLSGSFHHSGAGAGDGSRRRTMEIIWDDIKNKEQYHLGSIHIIIIVIIIIITIIIIIIYIYIYVHINIYTNKEWRNK